MTNPEGGLGCHFFFHSLPKNAFLFPEIPFYFPQLQFHFHNCPSTFWKCPFVSRNCIFVFQKILFIFQKYPIFFFRKLALAFRMSIQSFSQQFLSIQNCLNIKLFHRLYPHICTGRPGNTPQIYQLHHTLAVTKKVPLKR